MSKFTFIFPIETISRELDSRLVLASLYGRRDHRIFLAHAPHANRLAAKLSGGGLYVGKHIMASGEDESLAYERAKKNNFNILQLAEEGAVFMGGPEDWGADLDWQLKPWVLAKEDYVATWGEWQKNHYLSRGVLNPNNFRTIGHPRFDIYKGHLKNIYLSEAEELKKRYGDFILFNSSLTWAVNPLGVQDTFSRWQGYYSEDEKSRLRFVQRWARQNVVYAGFIELIHHLAIKYPKFNIIIRPHPSDDIAQIRAVVSGVQNIKVIRENSVAPWILASRVMLNDGCTTAIEAYLMGTPVVNFTPVKNEHEAFLPNLLGIRAWNQQEAFEAIEEAMCSENQEKNLPEIAHQVFANFRQDSMGLFLDLLSEAESKLSRTNIEPTLGLLMDQARFAAVEKAKQLARKCFFEKRHRAAMATNVLFPGFNKKYVKNRLDLIAKITGRPVEVKHYSPWLIELNPISQNPMKWPFCTTS